jgi:hypothetical protein
MAAFRAAIAAAFTDGLLDQDPKGKGGTKGFFPLNTLSLSMRSVKI